MISVIVPAYNIAPYIERCVNSILNQTYSNLEILLVDDGSTDDTPAIVDRLAEKDCRIRVFHIENNGVSNARNTALDVAKGDYISIIDGDDWIEPTLFEDAIKAMNEHDADAFMFEYYVDYETHKDAHSVNENLYGVIDSKKAIQYSIDVENRFAWSKIFKKSLTDNIFFDTDIILGEDTLYICNVLANANKVVYSNKPYYHYIIREGSAVNSVFNRKKLSGMAAYQGVVDLCNELGYGDVSLIAKKSLADLGIQLVKCILKTDYSQKNQDLEYLKSIIMQCKKDLLSSNYLDNKMKIKFFLASINVNLIKFL